MLLGTLCTGDSVTSAGPGLAGHVGVKHQQQERKMKPVDRVDMRWGC
jgi:hypothetical protein